MTADMVQSQGHMSIGALSKATGVPVETLRTWERRYGFPVANRTESGHRRYTFDTLRRLQLVTEALAQGHRPSEALTADDATLHLLIGPAARSVPAARPSPEGPPPAEVDMEAWFERVQGFESRAFERELRGAWNALGARAFVLRCVGPFLRELGERWASGALGVRHEHFASERLREFLTAQWRPISDAATGPSFVLAVPAGERHVLGLHLVATILTLAGGRVVFLGADTPAGEIGKAAAFHAAEAVLLSVAEGADPARMLHEQAAIREAVPAQIPVLAGGRGLTECVEGVTEMPELSDLERWLRAR